jgi:hypothetical protein
MEVQCTDQQSTLADGKVSRKGSRIGQVEEGRLAEDGL